MMSIPNRFINGNLTELQDANRNPIYGYQDKPVMCLEEALKPVISIVLELKKYVPLAKQHCKQNSSILTLDESASIYLYTMPVAFYSSLNEYLRRKRREDLKPWFCYLKLFISALEKLPIYENTIWRGVTGEINSSYSENDVKEWWSVNSCSKALNVLEPYIGDTGTLFAINALNGRDISEYSAVEDEQEVILMPGSVLCVNSKPLVHRNKLTIVHLQQILIDEPKKSA